MRTFTFEPELTMTIQDQVARKVEEVCQRIERHYPMFPPINRPVVRYDLRGRTAGQAINGKTIRLNLALLGNPRYFEEMLNNTLPHEVTHIACQQWWPKERVAHGLKWRQMMGVIGLPATRCHQYEVTPARTTRRPHAYQCACQTHYVTNLLHERMTHGQTYKCRKCGTKLRKED
jgi:SprT protein